MEENDYPGVFTFFALFIIMAGLSTSFSLIEGFIVNITDATKYSRNVVVPAVCLLGIVISAIFTTNFGWVLFDLVDHYIQSYVLLGIGIL